jgi:hypothetical protein
MTQMTRDQSFESFEVIWVTGHHCIIPYIAGYSTLTTLASPPKNGSRIHFAGSLELGLGLELELGLGLG